MERATASRRRNRTPIENVPAFRNHLEREGITFDQFKKRQSLAPAGDATSEALNLARRKVMTNKRKAA